MIYRSAKLQSFGRKNLRQLFFEKESRSSSFNFQTVFFLSTTKLFYLRDKHGKALVISSPSIKYHFYFYLSFIRCFLLGQFYFCSTFITFNKNGFSGNAEPTNETHFEWESNIVWSNFDRYTNPINFQNILCNLTMLSECIHNACKYCF